MSLKRRNTVRSPTPERVATDPAVGATSPSRINSIDERDGIPVRRDGADGHGLGRAEIDHPAAQLEHELRDLDAVEAIGLRAGEAVVAVLVPRARMEFQKVEHDDRAVGLRSQKGLQLFAARQNRIFHFHTVHLPFAGPS